MRPQAETGTRSTGTRSGTGSESETGTGSESATEMRLRPGLETSLSPRQCEGTVNI